MTLSSQPVLMTIWIACMLAQGAVLALIVARRAYREYPAFTAFVAYCVVRSSVLFAISHLAVELYQPVKWIAYAPQLVILVVLVREVFHILFHPYDTLPQRTLAYFGQGTIAVAIAAIAFAVRFPGAQPTAWMTFARATDQVVTWVLCAVFAFIALFATYFGIPWRHRLYGIGIGFLFYLSVDVAVETVIAQLRLPPYSVTSKFGMFAFLASCLIWIYYFATPETPRSVPTLEQLQKIQAVLRSLAITVKGLQPYGAGSSLRAMPTVEEPGAKVCDKPVSGR